MTQAIRDFVSADFHEEIYYSGVVHCDIAEIAPYFDEFVDDCKRAKREIPEGLSPELYVGIWNELADAYEENEDEDED